MADPIYTSPLDAAQKRADDADALVAKCLNDYEAAEMAFKGLWALADKGERARLQATEGTPLHRASALLLTISAALNNAKAEQQQSHRLWWRVSR